VEFSKKARQWRGLLLSNKALIEGMDYGTKAQGAEVVQIVWKGVEKWERRPKAGGNRRVPACGLGGAKNIDASLRARRLAQSGTSAAPGVAQRVPDAL
jgi:hypothetical protein